MKKFFLQTVRRAGIAPNVEHVGILFSAAAKDEARLWLDVIFRRVSEVDKITFVWILTLFAGNVIGWVLIARLIPKTKIMLLFQCDNSGLDLFYVLLSHR